jgi:outer membrane protein assembly factor BamB
MTGDRKEMASRFHELATFRGRGGMLKELIGPGPAAGSERLYRSHIYIGNTLDIVAIDPDSGAHTVFTSPVKSEPGAWAMALGPDGKLYVGTLPHAHVLRLDPATGAFTDMGRPSETEEYIWQLALGSDRRLYGCTYPNCKLVRFDPATGRGEDLGRMDPQQQYARSVAASDDGFVYVGIGTTRMHLVAYEIRTGEHRDLLPDALRVTGTAGVVRGDDGTVYATAGSKHFRLRGWEATPIDAKEYRPGGALRLRDGRLVAMEGATLRVTDPATHEAKTKPVAYEGKATHIFRIGRGPDGMLYGSSMMPIHFFRVDPKNGELRILGEVGGGEYYSFLRHGDALLGAAYSGQAPLMIYRPEKPFHPGPGASDNPRMVHFEGEDSGWRPQAMIAGPGDKVYLGAVAGYGKLGGPLAVFDPETRVVETFPHIVKDQSVVSLTLVDDQIVGGTTIDGGGGSFPTATEAMLFIWDPKTKKKLFETTPVPGARGITGLIAGPEGRVFGIAGGKELFVFDAGARKVIHRATLPFSGVIYNAVAAGPDGRLYGLCGDGVFVIDPRTYEARLEADYPERITAGFALAGSDLYFVAGARVVRYAIAAPR